MKYTLLTLVIFIQAHAAAQILNGSFENWTLIDSYSDLETAYSFSSTNEGLFYATGNIGVSEVLGTEGSALRVQTLQVAQDTVVSFGLFGEPSVGEDLVFSDGILFSSAVPDTLRLRSRFDINETYPGSVFLQFFGGGELVTIGNAEDSIFIQSISGVQEEWDTLNIDLTLLEFNSPPDECVIGFSSNDIFTGTGTPGNFLEIDYLELLSSEDTLLVSDFNTWALTESPLQVDEWDSFFGPASGYIFQSDDSSSGSYSLGLMNQAVDTNIIQASVFLASVSDFGINPNQELPEGAFMLKFNYKYETIEPDSARVNILLARDSMVVQDSQDSIPEILDVTRATRVLKDTSEWTEVLFEFGSLLDSANYFGIEFFAGPQYPGEPADSSILLIDQVEILSIDSCGFNPSFTPLQSQYCPEEFINLSATSSDSYIWFIKEQEEELFTLVSDSSNFNISFNESGDYSYFLIAEQDGCFQSSDTSDFSILTLEIPLLTAEGLETLGMCANSSLELSISNASSFSQFTWNLGTDSITTSASGNLIITGMEDFSGTYTVEAQSAECALQLLSSNSVNISTYPLNLPEITQNGNTIGAESFNNYQWSFNGEEIPGAISQFYNPLEDGSYSVEVTDEFGCEFISDSFFFSEVGLEELSSLSWSVYPNPATDYLTVECHGGSGFIELINSLGQVIKSIEVNSSYLTGIDIIDLNPGIYYLNYKNLKFKAIVIE